MTHVYILEYALKKSGEDRTSARYLIERVFASYEAAEWFAMNCMGLIAESVSWIDLHGTGEYMYTSAKRYSLGEVDDLWVSIHKTRAYTLEQAKKYKSGFMV